MGQPHTGIMAILGSFWFEVRDRNPVLKGESQMLWGESGNTGGIRHIHDRSEPRIGIVNFFPFIDDFSPRRELFRAISSKNGVK